MAFVQTIKRPCTLPRWKQKQFNQVRSLSYEWCHFLHLLKLFKKKVKKKQTYTKAQIACGTCSTAIQGHLDVVTFSYTFAFVPSPRFTAFHTQLLALNIYRDARMFSKTRGDKKKERERMSKRKNAICGNTFQCVRNVLDGIVSVIVFLWKRLRFFLARPFFNRNWKCFTYKMLFILVHSFHHSSEHTWLLNLINLWAIIVWLNLFETLYKRIRRCQWTEEKQTLKIVPLTNRFVRDNSIAVK